MGGVRHLGSLAGSSASLKDAGAGGLDATPLLLPTGSSPTTFATPGTGPRCIAVDPATGNLLSHDIYTLQIYVHIGLTATIGSSFAAPTASWVRDIEVDPATGDLLCLRGATVYVQDGISATTGSTITVGGGDGITVIDGNLYILKASTREVFIYDGISDSLLDTLTLDVSYGSNLDTLCTDPTGTFLIASSQNNSHPQYCFNDKLTGGYLGGIDDGATAQAIAWDPITGQSMALELSLDKVRLGDMEQGYILDGNPVARLPYKHDTIGSF